MDRCETCGVERPRWLGSAHKCKLPGSQSMEDLWLAYGAGWVYYADSWPLQ